MSGKFVLSVLTLSLLFLFILPLISVQALVEGYTNVTVTQAKTMIDSNPSLVLLDVRTQSEYNSGHIRNAKLIPHTELEGRLNELNKTDEILVYCRTGMRSAIASQILANNGFSYVYNMLEGITAWVNEEYPVYVKYSSIQQAINNASEGDTVFVSSGTYYENVVLNKLNLTLLGENRHTTVIDGNGASIAISLEANNTKISEFTVQNGSCGIQMFPWTSGHIICNNVISNNDYGISGHYDCTNISISDNIITSNNIAGIEMLFSHSIIGNNLISDNGKGEFQGCGSGIQIVRGINSEVVYCVNNTVSGNTIKNHQIGVWAIRYSEENLFFHNNLVNNTFQVSLSPTTWNNSVIENYWSDYDGIDANKDGIGDISYKIDNIAQDDHPLMGMFHDFNTYRGYRVNVVSNSTIESFEYFGSNSTIKMYVSNASSTQTFGFCRVCIPKALISPPYTVMINDESTEVLYFNDNIQDNGTHRWIYFAYRHSVHKVDIIPEFQPILILPLFITATLLAIMVCRRKYFV